MADTLEIALGIVGGVIGVYLTFGLIDSFYGNSVKKDLQNPQTLQGQVVEEHYDYNPFGSNYFVSVRSDEGTKSVVYFDSHVAGWEVPSMLNTLFAPGDNVSLSVGQQKKEIGTQFFTGLEGRLVREGSQ